MLVLVLVSCVGRAGQSQRGEAGVVEDEERETGEGGFKSRCVHDVISTI